MLTLAILNHLIQQDKTAQRQWQLHTGRVLSWVLPMCTLHGRIDQQGFWQADPAEADATITVSESALVKILSGQQAGVGDILIEGDRPLAMAVLPLMQRLHYDWRDDLARLLGDAVGGALALKLDQLKQYAQDSQKSIKAQLTDYLHERDAVVVGQSTFQWFSREVACLRDDEARLAQRLQRLEQQLASRDQK